jgi:hypothetical protein
MSIRIARYARYETDREEPYVWYDDRGYNPGWVLRYSLSDKLGQRHLNEPLPIDEYEASDDELIHAAGVALEYVGLGATLSVGPHCGHCGQEVPTTHIHHSADGTWAEHGCAFNGQAYVPDACNGDDLCDDCIEALDLELEW